MRILYLEDDSGDANLVKRYLQTTPHDLLIAATVREAWASLTEPIDLILVDILLANSRDGYSFAREVRERNITQPLIAVTALNMPQEIEAARDAGFDDVLAKPFEITELSKIIQRYAN